LPPLLIGAFLNVVGSCQFRGQHYLEAAFAYVIIWLWLYGCAAHGAAFFMTRGMKVFGWIFICVACLLVSISLYVRPQAGFDVSLSPFLLMGVTFGGLHLAYGIYLYITEKGKNAA
jgi:hypothetical protein